MCIDMVTHQSHVLAILVFYSCYIDTLLFYVYGMTVTAVSLVCPVPLACLSSCCSYIIKIAQFDFLSVTSVKRDAHATNHALRNCGSCYLLWNK